LKKKTQRQAGRESRARLRRQGVKKGACKKNKPKAGEIALREHVLPAESSFWFCERERSQPQYRGTAENFHDLRDGLSTAKGTTSKTTNPKQKKKRTEKGKKAKDRGR